MQTDVETLPEDRVRLTVEVAAHDVDHAFEHALRDLAKDVRIPGFRKGKVPAKVVLARLGPEAVTEEALRTHLGSWYARAVTQARIEPVDQPDIDWSDPPQEGVPFAFTATVQVAPGATLPDDLELEAAREEVEIPEGAVDGELERLRTAAAELAPLPPDTPAGPGPLRAHRLHGHARRQGAEGRERHRLQRRGRRGPPRRRARAGAARHEGRRDEAGRRHLPGRLRAAQGRRPHRAVRPAPEGAQGARAAGARRRLRRAGLGARDARALRAAIESEVDEGARPGPRGALPRRRDGRARLGRDRRRAARDGRPARARPSRGPRRGSCSAAASRSTRTCGRAAARRSRPWTSCGPRPSGRCARSSPCAPTPTATTSASATRSSRRSSATRRRRARRTPDRAVERLIGNPAGDELREDLRLRAALDHAVAHAKAITPDQAAAREKLWTPGQDAEKAESGRSALWLPPTAQ